MLQHLARPRDRLDLEIGERHDLVHKTHIECRRRVVLLAQVPDLPRLLLSDDARQQARPEPAVERTNPRPGLAEARVVGRNGQVAHDVQYMTTTDRVAGDHRDNRFREPADLYLQVEDVEPADALVVAVAVVAPHALVAAGTERVGPFTREDDDADLRIVTRDLECVA